MQNLSSSGASIQGLPTGKAGTAGAQRAGAKLTPAGPDFYNQSAGNVG